MEDSDDSFPLFLALTHQDYPGLKGRKTVVVVVATCWWWCP